jgi:hypothetical protein
MKKEDVRYKKVWKKNGNEEGHVNKELTQESVLSGIVVQYQSIGRKKEVRFREKK